MSLGRHITVAASLALFAMSSVVFSSAPVAPKLSLESLQKQVNEQAKIIQKQAEELKAFKEQKVGVINLRDIVLRVNDGIDAQKNLKAEMTKVETDLMQKQTELTTMQKKLMDDAPLMTEVAKQQEQKRIEEKFMSFKRVESDSKMRLQKMERDAFEMISSKAAKLVEFEAEKLGLKRVYHEEGLVWADPSNFVRLTEPVISTYNDLKKKKVVASKEKK